jgi:DNA-binding CsgD family transcriptional regulator
VTAWGCCAWSSRTGSTWTSRWSATCAAGAYPSSSFPAAVAPLVTLAYGLSERESQVTRLCMQGVSTRQMAHALALSPHTVQDHLKSIFAKTGVRSQARELTTTRGHGSVSEGRAATDGTGGGPSTAGPVIRLLSRGGHRHRDGRARLSLSASLNLASSTRKYLRRVGPELKAGPGREVHPIPVALTDPERPGRTLVSTALSRRSLIGMRPLVQVQPGRKTARDQRKGWSLRFDWSARSDPSRWGMRS